MPIHIAASVTTSAPSSPTVTDDFVVHFPEEIVAEAVDAERLGELVVVACREPGQAQALSAMLLSASVGSAVITTATTGFDLRQTLEAFGYGDFTVLLATDDVMVGWQAPAECRRLLHADLPATPGTRQFFAAVRSRRERVPGLAQVSRVA